jgi:hypothetical protein
MRIKAKSMLAWAVGVSILLAPAKVDPPGLFFPYLPVEGRAVDGKAKDTRLRSGTGDIGGLYGYRYRGF